MSDTACQTHVLRVALIALAASLWACDSKLSRTDRAASALDGAEQSGVDQGVAPAGDQRDLPDSAVATSDSAPLERDSASGTEADAKVTPNPDTSVGPKPDAKVTPKPDTSVGPKPDGPTGTGGQAARA